MVDIRVPLFIDKETVVPFGLSAPESNGHVGKSHTLLLHSAPSGPQLISKSVSAKPGPHTPYIKMDAMAFGMGCCCLQITFQAWNVNEARRVYDALVPVAPIMVSPFTVIKVTTASADEVSACFDSCESGF